ncbi:hypothetical protein CFP65_4643 [Kitasatospora sp. MMS16-BH015]|uniref:hypothetical protein n=1 Tax=Kitasatospora sp. MMS16-BH015 TaxID=2018025 RepID=UPI000CA3DC41|nr:hypothetical protein [Kitasatospora sp. MMS16-BH015]AUG79374.1 hypothetical protein CFP65_4643 [Kitasatospora sp. MMS16-BH015]
MDHPARRALLTGAVLAATLPALLTGCAADHRTPADHPTPPVVTDTPPAPESGRAGMAALPLAAYQPDDATLQQQSAIRVSLAVSCMHKAGFASFTADSYQGDTPSGTNNTALPAGAWGYLGSEAAETQGFHPAGRPTPSPTATGRPSAGPSEASEAYVSARVECDRRIVDAFQPSDQLGTELVNRLFAESLQAAEQDTRVTEATRTWSTCMTTAGHPATTPEALLQHYRTAPAVTPAELAAARADTACTTSTHLAGLYFAVLAGYQRQQITRNATALADHQQALHEDATRFAKLLTTTQF